MVFQYLGSDGSQGVSEGELSEGVVVGVLEKRDLGRGDAKGIVHGHDGSALLRALENGPDEGGGPLIIAEARISTRITPADDTYGAARAVQQVRRPYYSAISQRDGKCLPW